MSHHRRVNAFDPALSSGVWDGLSYRQGCEGLDETRWTDTSVVFTDIRKGGKLLLRGSNAPAWGREEPPSAIFRLCGKGISHWRGRQIHFVLRGFVEPPPGGSDQLLRITLIKRHNGSFSNIVHYGGTLSQSGFSIQGTFSDGHFRLRQVGPVSHVLARELSGAWDGESSCRRGGQSSTTWKSVRLAFHPLAPGDGRGWGMLVTGGGDSLWNDQRIPFCITGRLSLPGLEVELEKQHLEGYHNRIAYFGRVLPGGGGDKPDGCPGNDSPPPTRLVGVYEHGDFVLLRNPNADLDSSSRTLGGGSSSSSSSSSGHGSKTRVGGGGGGPGRGAEGGAGDPSVLEACIDLFRRSSDTSSVWNKAGLHRPAIVPPMARSHSGDGGLPGGPGTLMPPGPKYHVHQNHHHSHLNHLHLHLQQQQAPRLSPPPHHHQPQRHNQHHQHQQATRVSPMNGGGDGGGVGENREIPMATSKILLRRPLGAGNPATPDTSPLSSGGDGRGSGSDGGRGDREGGGGGGGEGMEWDFMKEPRLAWEQANGSAGGTGRRDDGKLDNGSSTMAGCNGFGFLDGGGGGGGDGGSIGRDFGEDRAGIIRPTDSEGSGGEGGGGGGAGGDGGWTGMFDDGPHQQQGSAATGTSSSATIAAAATATASTTVRATLMSLGSPSFADGGGWGGRGGDRGHPGGRLDGGMEVGYGSNDIGVDDGIVHGSGNEETEIKTREGLQGMRVLKMSLADSDDPGEGPDDRRRTAASATESAAVAYLHQCGGDGGRSATNGDGNANDGGETNAPHLQHQNRGRSSEPGALGVLSTSSAPSSELATEGAFLHRVNCAGGGVLLPSMKFTPPAPAAAAGLSPPTFTNVSSSTGYAGEDPASMAPLATISAAASAASTSMSPAGKPVNKQQIGDGSGGGGSGREAEGRCKMCYIGSVDALLLPCGHLGLCQSCAGALHECPVCDADIYRVQPVCRS